MRAVGQRFNPFRLFNGIFIPEALVRWSAISPGAKLCYGRLARYAGEKGRCYPSQSALAAELGVTERNARRYLQELESNGLIRIVRRGLQLNNEYEFLWHGIFDGSERTNPSGQEGTKTSYPDRQHSSSSDGTRSSGPSEGESSKESHLERELGGGGAAAGESTSPSPHPSLFNTREGKSAERWTKTLAAMQAHSLDAGIGILRKTLSAVSDLGVIDDGILAVAVEIAFEERAEKLAAHPILLAHIIPDVLQTMKARGVELDHNPEKDWPGGAQELTRRLRENVDVHIVRIVPSEAKTTARRRPS